MYGYTEQSVKQELPTVAGVICPECYKHLVSPTVLPQERHSSGNTIRSYFGWCFGCNKGFAAFQFFNPALQRWVLWKYKEYVLVGGKPVLNNQDHVVCPLSEIPVIQTGSGPYASQVGGEQINQTIRQAKDVLLKLVLIAGEVKDVLNKLKIENGK